MTRAANPTRDIPIDAAKRIAAEYGYDQVVIIGRKVGEGGREHVTTYGVDKAHCGVAARMGHFFKHKLMGWPDPAAQDLLQALEEARNGLLWYRDRYPEAVDGSDDEAMARIDAAIAKATGVAA